ncbi:hypothetical protein BGW36DRAFT_375959 [Talaromyces proteolyticus]|uniref:Uncharacterized protein n=1 Tax=Talaromyces proteolyticus TaxID=1131652 RepID=A0AAD4KQQ7_9EURO|nr:uncharacterized protein BGW36DRAFT_375959 [Talaromyces proteolyticus]KAH8698375.1 hypothetical protein BGW36DRAFT_375959 [Talaromyces proteolyticus]
MRSETPTPKVQGVDGSKLYDMRILGVSRGFDPFGSIQDFHAFLTDGFEMSTEQFPELNRLVMMHQKSNFATYFTPGNLNIANILVRGDNVVGIQGNWECKKA